MTTAIVAIFASQLVLAGLLFGTVSLDRADVPRWLRSHPVAARHRQARSESAAALHRRQSELDRLGAAARRAATERVA